MSTSAQFENSEEFQEALGSVRNDNTENVYVTVGHLENDPTRLTVVKIGQDLEDIAENLDSSQVGW